MGGISSKSKGKAAISDENVPEEPSFEEIELNSFNGSTNIASPSQNQQKMVARSEDSATEYTTVAETPNRSKMTSTINSKVAFDDYPIYNPIDDINFESGKSFQKGCFPIDSTKKNIGIAGRKGSGKSALINALRGIFFSDRHAAGKCSSEKMEPFNFIEDEFKNMVLWEIPYPQTFTSVVEVYDRNMGFDRFYEGHKLHLFELIIVLLPDGDIQDGDVAFSRIVHSHRTPLLFLKTKTDEDLDTEARETNMNIGEKLKDRYTEKAQHVLYKVMHQKAQVLEDTDLLFISSPVVEDLLCGSSGSLLYKMDEDKLIALLELRPGCHHSMRNAMQKQAHSYGTQPTVTGPYSTTGKSTAFNYGFAGGSGVGKSALINGIRGISGRHPLAAGRMRMKPGTCQRHEFDDDLLAYSVTLWELRYPRKISAYFEYIDQYQLANFTAIFIIINGTPTEQDLTFAKIAFRREATIVFLMSKCDKILMARSRSEEIPVGDLLKQRIVDKGIVRFDRTLSTKAPELRGRVHLFFVSAKVFKSFRNGDSDSHVFLLHERAVFDFLKQKRMIAEMMESPDSEYKEGLYANVNDNTPPSPTSPMPELV